MAMMFASRGFAIGYINEPLVRYREYSESVSQSDKRFGSMVMWAVYDYRKKLAFQDKEYVKWWHSYIYAMIERAKVQDNTILKILSRLLKFTDLQAIKSRIVSK